MRFKFDINRYTWLGYPLFVLMFIISCTNVLLASQEQVQAVFSKRSQIQSVENQVEQLKGKLEALREIDGQALSSDLDLLTTAVPASRQVWSMISAIRHAATSSLVVLDSYRSSVGDVREATFSARLMKKDSGALDITASFEVDDLTSLAALSEQLNNLLPLLRVSSVKYSSNKADLVIEGAWIPRKGATNDVKKPLPDYFQNLERAKLILVERKPVPSVSNLEGEPLLPVSGVKLF